eukprot:gene19256-21184_t
MSQPAFQVRSYSAIEPKYYKLPGVKECLYHPNLPTFRRMDIDTAAHKLPEQHCRTATPCSARDFMKGSVTFHVKSAGLNKDNLFANRYWRYRHLYSYTDSTRKEQKDETDENASSHDNDPVTNAQRGQLTKAKKPWKFVLRQEPYIDHIGQRPTPATTL